MTDLLGSDFSLVEAHYACHGLLLAPEDGLFSHLTGRRHDMFNAEFDVLLHDLTSTYFEVDALDLPEGDIPDRPASTSLRIAKTLCANST
jgi:hypothetical protein